MCKGNRCFGLIIFILGMGMFPALYSIISSCVNSVKTTCQIIDTRVETLCNDEFIECFSGYINVKYKSEYTRWIGVYNKIRNYPAMHEIYPIGKNISCYYDKTDSTIVSITSCGAYQIIFISILFIFFMSTIIGSIVLCYGSIPFTKNNYNRYEQVEQDDIIEIEMDTIIR